MINSIFLQHIPLRHDVFGRNIALDILYGGKDKTAVESKVLDPLTGIGAYLIRCSAA